MSSVNVRAEADEVSTIASVARAEGKRIALVTGVFDLIHAGHVHLLDTARASADLVICGLYDDASARVLKGPGRPIMPLEERIAIVAALRSVDVVISLEIPNANALIETLRPDVFLYGNDDASQSHVMSAGSAALRNGGVVVPLELVSASSTAAIVRKLTEGVDVSLNWLSPGAGAGASAPSANALVSFPYIGPQRPGRSVERFSRTITLRGRTERDLIFDAIVQARRFYDDFPLQRLAISTPGDGVVVDVGANIGNHTVFFGAFMARKVVAIEPVPELFQILVENIAGNGLDNVIPIQAAAGKEERPGLIFHPPSSVENAGAIQVRPLPSDAPASADTVSIRPLDSLLAELDGEIADLPVTLLKIDVEGSEQSVILGALETIAKHRPLIYVELALESTFTAVARILNRLGYRATQRFGDVIPSYIFVPDGKPTVSKRAVR